MAKNTNKYHSSAKTLHFPLKTSPSTLQNSHHQRYTSETRNAKAREDKPSTGVGKQYYYVIFPLCVCVLGCVYYTLSSRRPTTDVEELLEWLPKQLFIPPAQRLYHATRKFDQQVNHELKPWMEQRLAQEQVKMKSSVAMGKRGKISKVFYLRTHRAASASIQNMLLRYAYKNNLSVAIPLSSLYTLAPEEPCVTSHNYDIVAHQLDFYDANLVAGKMGRGFGKDRVWFTALREPASQYESFYNAYKYGELLGLDLKTFISDPFQQYFTHLASITRAYKSAYMNLRNSYLLDLAQLPYGFESAAASNHNSVANLMHVVRHVDSHFDLVMIVERWDESLVLLKHLLGWPYEDMVALVKNRRVATLREKVSESNEKKIRLWNRADSVIYEYYYRKLELQIQAFGEEEMKRERRKLEAARSEVYRSCVLPSGGEEGSGVRWWSSETPERGLLRNSVCGKYSTISKDVHTDVPSPDARDTPEECCPLFWSTTGFMLKLRREREKDCALQVKLIHTFYSYWVCGGLFIVTLIYAYQHTRKWEEKKMN